MKKFISFLTILFLIWNGSSLGMNNSIGINEYTKNIQKFIRNNQIKPQKKPISYNLYFPFSLENKTIITAYKGSHLLNNCKKECFPDIYDNEKLIKKGYVKITQCKQEKIMVINRKTGRLTVETKKK